MSSSKGRRPAAGPTAPNRMPARGAGTAPRGTSGRGPRRPAAGRPSPAPTVSNPWNALWAMMIGFFMILVDSTIVAVANPSIMEKLQTDYDAVIWVTSAYLLAYAVPLLVAGRLGDQFGPKNLYLIGLLVFTAASVWCGLSGSIETLIAARVVQGIGAALLTPQTLSTITRIFPAERRGVAMSVWGATAGVATLVGPLAGGILVDHLGWQWIFFVNVPIGIVALLLGWAASSGWGDAASVMRALRAGGGCLGRGGAYEGEPASATTPKASLGSQTPLDALKAGPLEPVLRIQNGHVEFLHGQVA